MSNKYIDWGLWDKKEAPLGGMKQYWEDPLQYLAGRATDALNADFGINRRLVYNSK
jgi:hypothetical protein